MTGSFLDFDQSHKVAPELGAIQIHVLTFVAERSPAPIAAETLRVNLDSKGAYWAKAPDQRIVAVFPLTLTLHTANTEAPVELGHIVLQYQVVYDLRKELETWSDAALQSFSAYYGACHIWPYARADVQALTTKIGLPVLTLPVLRFGHLPAGFTINQLSTDDPDPAEGGPAQQ